MTDPVDLPSGSVIGMVAELIPYAAVEPPPVPGLLEGPTVAFAVPLPGPKGEDGADLSPEDLEELTGVVTENVETAMEPPISLVLLFENALE